MKNIKTLFLAGIVAVSAFSCTNLDEEIFSQITADNFFRTPEEFDAAVVSAYTSLYGSANHNSFWSIQEVSSDELAISQKGGDWFDGGQWLRMHRHEFNDKEEAFNNAWNFIFGITANCNRLIEQVELVVPADPAAETAKAKTIAELRTLRALAYYWLIDAYGNVPIVTSFSNADENPATNSRAEVFAFIETEVLASIPDLPAENIYSKVTQGVAHALLAKLYINAEVYIGTPKYTETIAQVDAIDALGHWALSANFFDNFNATNEGSAENIFAVPYDQVFATGFNLPVMTLHYSSQATYNLTAQPWNGYVTLQEFYESYEAGDVRREGILVGQQFSSTGEPLVDASYEKADPDDPEKPFDPDGETLIFTPEINELEPNALRQAGGRIAKFPYELGATENLNNDYPIFRYGDMVLLKAEALWRLNNGDANALTLVNSIRSRAGVAPLGALTADDLLAERGREMYAEGQRRQDLIRFGRFNDAWWEKNVSESFRTLFPIPDPQRLANDQLQQNPGY